MNMHLCICFNMFLYFCSLYRYFQTQASVFAHSASLHQSHVVCYDLHALPPITIKAGQTDVSRTGDQHV